MNFVQDWGESFEVILSDGCLTINTCKAAWAETKTVGMIQTGTVLAPGNVGHPEKALATIRTAPRTLAAAIAINCVDVTAVQTGDFGEIPKGAILTGERALTLARAIAIVVLRE